MRPSTDTAFFNSAVSLSSPRLFAIVVAVVVATVVAAVVATVVAIVVDRFVVSVFLMVVGNCVVFVGCDGDGAVDDAVRCGGDGGGILWSYWCSCCSYWG